MPIDLLPRGFAYVYLMLDVFPLEFSHFILKEGSVACANFISVSDAVQYWLVSMPVAI